MIAKSFLFLLCFIQLIFFLLYLFNFCYPFQTLFVLSLGPFVFLNVQKTKYLQYMTSAMRWIAFSIMIIYALRKIIVDGPQGKPPLVNVAGNSKNSNAHFSLIIYHFFQCDSFLLFKSSSVSTIFNKLFYSQKQTVQNGR